MDIFEYVNNEKFFKPLSSKNKRIYFECINVLIEKSKEVPILYDSDARSCVAIYLKNSEYEFNDEEENSIEMEERPERNASAIMAYLRDCGWVTPREIGRNGENVANVSTPCRRIIEFLKKMSEKSNEGALSNHIFSMYEILKSSFGEDSARMERPYTNVLKPLMDDMVELKNELLDLKENIANIMRVVMELQDVNSVGNFLMKDELLNRFFNDYFFIKNNGLIPSQLAFIKNKLRIISESDKMVKIISECAVQKQLEEMAAKEKVEGYIASLQYFLTIEYEENMEHIDARINTYYNLANTRLMLVMSNGVNMASVLDSFLSAVKVMDDREKEEVLEKVADSMLVSSQKYISRRSYQKRVRKDRDDSLIGLPEEELSEEEKLERTKDIMSSTRNRFNIDGTKQFFAERLANREELHLAEQKVESKEDAIMFAASVMYSEIEEFGYEVELKEDHVETDVAKITNMIIRRK